MHAPLHFFVAKVASLTEVVLFLEESRIDSGEAGHENSDYYLLHFFCSILVLGAVFYSTTQLRASAISRYCQAYALPLVSFAAISPPA